MQEALLLVCLGRVFWVGGRTPGPSEYRWRGGWVFGPFPGSGRLGNPDDAAVHRASGFSVLGSRAGRLVLFGLDKWACCFWRWVTLVQELVPLLLSGARWFSHVGLALHVCPWRQPCHGFSVPAQDLCLGQRGCHVPGQDLCLTPSPAAMSLV